MKWAYNPKLKTLAQQLRKRMTLGEVLLWAQLKSQQRQGVDFHRQKPIDEFIIDFFSSELALAIEIDGRPMISKWMQISSDKSVWKAWELVSSDLPRRTFSSIWRVWSPQ